MQPRTPEPVRRAVGGSAKVLELAKRKKRSDQSQWRLHAVAENLILPGYRDSFSPAQARVRRMGIRALPLGHRWTARLRGRQLRAGVKPSRPKPTLERQRTRACLRGCYCAKAYGWSPKERLKEQRARSNQSIRPSFVKQATRSRAVCASILPAQSQIWSAERCQILPRPTGARIVLAGGGRADGLLARTIAESLRKPGAGDGDRQSEGAIQISGPTPLPNRRPMGTRC